MAIRGFQSAGISTLSPAEAELLEADVVLGSTLDCGHYRFGLNQPAPTLFSGIPRSTAHVLQVTLGACKQLHFRT